jgi:hypothetical protein
VLPELRIAGLERHFSDGLQPESQAQGVKISRKIGVIAHAGGAVSTLYLRSRSMNTDIGTFFRNSRFFISA